MTRYVLLVTQTLLIACLAIVARAQDASVGIDVFRANCAICHSTQPGRTLVGPSLFGVVDRHSGKIPGFRYSSANLNSGLVWNVATLDRYIAAPRQVIPGTFMTFPGLKDAARRADLIAYLATLH